VVISESPVVVGFLVLLPGLSGVEITLSHRVDDVCRVIGG